MIDKEIEEQLQSLLEEMESEYSLLKDAQHYVTAYQHYDRCKELIRKIAHIAQKSNNEIIGQYYVSACIIAYNARKSIQIIQKRRLYR